MMRGSTTLQDSKVVFFSTSALGVRNLIKRTYPIMLVLALGLQFLTLNLCGITDRIAGNLQLCSIYVKTIAVNSCFISFICFEFWISIFSDDRVPDQNDNERMSFIGISRRSTYIQLYEGRRAKNLSQAQVANSA